MDSARPNGFAFNEAISLLVPCESQREIDYYWERLSADPKAEQCGWLKDKLEGRFVELVANERVVETVEFESGDAGLRGEMRITIILDRVAGAGERSAVSPGSPERIALLPGLVELTGFEPVTS